ncbi:mechanosensitive ion channel family protein [Runella slithyformis]|uniref:MscS Mechanosensitive ion channel n=1 Tax=Runella slithyformis (strain ATCC 29530 / DSM 19594 / LMG 11500 / NCIMB 11436 / LSU 4) TaxID=761193 RepID=A0A7U3ZNM3_RUNSL|nr:mechanosensitive ion channel family protein [Runella slithyformis]AEI50540.1 MscS Mechanosensitive ion channel [Runella slithyformis DSM 19594]
MEIVSKWLNYTILENPIQDLLWFLGIIGLGILIKSGLSLTISRTIYRFIKSESGSIPLADFVRLTRRPFELLITLVMIFWAFTHLTVPKQWGWASAERFGWLMIIERVFFTFLAAAVGWLGIRLIKFIALIFKQKAAETPTPLDDQLVPFFKDITIIIWTLTCFFFMLHKIYEVNVWALITSLGIGGLVIALAARETLENLIASVAIMLERPFVIGDSIVLDKISGEIEQIGFRSTRVRSDDGSLITVPNRLMTTQALENVTQRSYRRAKYYVRLSFDTSPETLTQIIKDIRFHLEGNYLTNSKTPTVRLENLAENSLDIVVIYHVHTSLWRVFMETKEEINFRIIEIVREHGATFAYPSRNLFIKESSDALRETT